MTSSRDENLGKLRAYLSFLKCSFWLPANYGHLLPPTLPRVLVNLIGHQYLDGTALDTVSALLSLLSQDELIVVACPAGVHPLQSFTMDSNLNKPVLSGPIIDESLWDRICELDSRYFSSTSDRLFRAWFQWVNLAVKQKVYQRGIYEDRWWQRLRVGLVTGFGDQRKYCLGILRQSLRLAQRSIETPLMTLDVRQLTAYEKQYEKYATLFETIVLDRYPNQVQACLPELSKLFGPASLVSPGWGTALLTAALNPKIQDGIRKIIGNWYIDHVVKEKGSVAEHTGFLFEGFLPWATQGSLFTSTLKSSRSSSVCSHGDALKNIIVEFFTATPTQLGRRELLVGTLQFVLDTGGKIFSPSVLYLLEGLLDGLKSHPVLLDKSDLDTVLRISRLSGFPEIASDLCITYCAQICEILFRNISLDEAPGYDTLNANFAALQDCKPDRSDHQNSERLIPPISPGNSSPLQEILTQLELSQHKVIQGTAFIPTCEKILSILEQNAPETLTTNALFGVLEALWEEADRQEFYRPVAVRIPPIFFHPVCMQAWTQQWMSDADTILVDKLTSLFTKSLEQLQRLAEGRSYLLACLTMSLRKACFSNPRIIRTLPLEDFLVRFINNPSAPKKEFLFEIAAAEKLQKYLPHRNYMSYYGRREWHAYAAIIDLLNRFPKHELAAAKRVFRRLLEPWKTQQAPIPIISKWKDIFQLQVMLLLTSSCISESDIEEYLNSFMHALVLEHWPRYRFLLEWIIAYIFYLFPIHSWRILMDLSKLDDTSPIQIASLLKLAVLVAPFLDSEDFALKLMIQLIPFSASPKVHIRHEAHWSVPIVFGLAEEKGWSSIIDNPAFQALNSHVRSLDKFNTPPSTIRTLKLDAVNDYTITEIFQGQYLTIETAEEERVTYEDFMSLFEEDSACTLKIPTASVPLGKPRSTSTSTMPFWKSEVRNAASMASPSSVNASFFQTKSGFDISALLPSSGHLSAQHRRSAPVILIASLIDNPTNLGGLSRISESFGLEALYIDDLKKTIHKDFKATSVTSEKHFPIRELKAAAVPLFLIDLKRKGYIAVGIEQTDKSGILGEDGVKDQPLGGSGTNAKGDGTLPKKCALVLGSEKGGITTEVLSVLDRCVEINTVGLTRSLNVQTAGGIAIYEWWREWGKSLQR